MRPNLILRCVSTVCFTALLGLFYAVPRLLAQGGEPQYFAIRGATVVPVAGPPMENATIVIARGLITAVGKDIAIPAEAWVVDGKGLTVYPGLIDSETHLGLTEVSADQMSNDLVELSDEIMPHMHVSDAFHAEINDEHI